MATTEEVTQAAPTAPVSAPERPTTDKPIHSLILDTGPLIKNDPSVSDLLNKAENLFILPSVVPEIKDKATRIRVETTLLPFVNVRAPTPASVKFIRDFARLTGDLGVLSKPDLEVLALGYELECERNGGDWRLRNTPTQKGVNGKPPHKVAAEAAAKQAEMEAKPEVKAVEGTESEPKTEDNDEAPIAETQATETISSDMQNLSVEEPAAVPAAETADAEVEEDEGDASDDDGGWITPSNLTKQKAKDAGTSTPAQQPQRTLQAAVLTSDYAMQNVALRMNLNLVTPSFTRITQLKTWVMRCHGCFKITRDMEKQFCPNCGQPTLTRVSCSTDEQGNFKVHLKRNFQWNNRGNVYSLPKPTHGTANGRLAKNVAGKGNWGQNLMLAEDQKEYMKEKDSQRRSRKKDLMDDDYLPNILSGDRAAPGKIRVGAGKNVNSRKRRN